MRLPCRRACRRRWRLQVYAFRLRRGVAGCAGNVTRCSKKLMGHSDCESRAAGVTCLRPTGLLGEGASQMRKHALPVFALMASALMAQNPPATSPAAQSSHQVSPAARLKWTPMELPGCQLASVSGDPSKAGDAFTIRIKCAAGTIIPAHWHPGAENVTVLNGTLMVGMGRQVRRRPPGEHAQRRGFHPHPRADAALRKGQRRNRHAGARHRPFRR